MQLLLWMMTITDWSASILATSKGFDGKPEVSNFGMVGFSFTPFVCILRVVCVWIGLLRGGGGSSSY
jgi:hypothetical protein